MRCWSSNSNFFLKKYLKDAYLKTDFGNFFCIIANFLYINFVLQVLFCTWIKRDSISSYFPLPWWYRRNQINYNSFSLPSFPYFTFWVNNFVRMYYFFYEHFSCSWRCFDVGYLDQFFIPNFWKLEKNLMLQPSWRRWQLEDIGDLAFFSISSAN